MTENTAGNPSASPPSALARLRERAVRISSYAMWITAGFILTLAVERLVLHPYLRAAFGEIQFGAFVWVLGIVNLVGTVAANGFTINLMRDLKRYEDEFAANYIRQAVLLTATFSFFILVASALVAYAIADAAVQENAFALFSTLIVFSTFRGMQQVLFAALRIERKFRTIFLLRVVEGAILLAILIVAGRQSFWGVGLVYVFSVLVPFVLAAVREPAFTMRREWWNGQLARVQLPGWVGGATLALTEQGQLQASRLILGIVTSTTEVTLLYAGTSMGNFFVAPVSIVSGLLFSLIASHQESRLTGRRGVLFLAAVIATGVAIWILSHFLGIWLVEWRYPEDAPTTLEFYPLIAASNGFTAVMILLRPVAIRYLAMRWVTAVSAATVLSQVVLLVWLATTHGARGAAIALLVSSVVGALLWLGTFIWLARRPTPIKKVS
ncbi:MAG: lipopolysaccharide biosynthesis protein [Phycisphaerae bacterium]